MSVFQYLADGVQNSMSQIKQAQGMGQGVHSAVQSYPNVVGSAWVGGDAEAFQEKVLTKLLPAIAELIAAIAGVNLNLTDATSAVDQADNKISGMAGNLKDMFSAI
jgi:uncharacterized protein YukE